MTPFELLIPTISFKKKKSSSFLPSITPPQQKVLCRDVSTVTHRLTHRFYSQGQCGPSVPSSVAGSTQTPPTGCKTTVHNAHSNTPQHHQKPSFAFFFFFLLLFFPLILLCCFPWDRVVSKAQLMNSRQLVGLKFIDRTATSQPAFLPGCVALIVQSVRSICYWAAPLAWQQRAGSITSIAWWLRREQRGHAC